MEELLLQVSDITLRGMLGIFGVLAMIMICVVVLNKLSQKNKSEEE